MGGQRIADRRGLLSLFGIPFTGPLLQGGNLIGQFLLQIGAQDIGKEVMVAKPLALVIERHEKEVAPF